MYESLPNFLFENESFLIKKKKKKWILFNVDFHADVHVKFGNDFVEFIFNGACGQTNVLQVGVL